MYSYNRRIEVYKYAVFSTILREHPNLDRVINAHPEGVVSGVLRHVQGLRMSIVVPIAGKMHIIP